MLFVSNQLTCCPTPDPIPAPPTYAHLPMDDCPQGGMHQDLMLCIPRKRETTRNGD